MTPTVALTTEIMYAGKPRTLKFGLLAYKDLGLNPFDPASIEAFKSQPMTLDLSAKLIRAALLHEYYGSNAPRKGQMPPSVDDVLADLGEHGQFGEVWNSLMGIFGGKDGEAAGDRPADPPSA